MAVWLPIVGLHSVGALTLRIIEKSLLAPQRFTDDYWYVSVDIP